MSVRPEAYYTITYHQAGIIAGEIIENWDNEDPIVVAQFIRKTTDYGIHLTRTTILVRPRDMPKFTKIRTDIINLISQ